MSRSADLRRIIGAMTWRHTWFARGRFLSRVQDNTGMGATLQVNHIGTMADRDDAKAIATLANHADAIVALIEACEQLDDVDRVQRDDHIEAIMRSQAIASLRAALAAVHAVRDEP